MNEFTVKKITIPSMVDRERIDKYLSTLDELNLSRAYIQKMINDELVIVDGRIVGKNYRLNGGELIELRIPPPDLPDLSPENIPLEIAYEDEDLVVVNKPAGLVVHPAPGNPAHTLVNALLYHFKELSGGGDYQRPGIIHRLDKDTSGLLLVAKNDSAALGLRRQLAERKIIKIYNAIICGHMADASGKINLPIGRSLRDRKKMAVTNLKSREAITHYKVIKNYRLNDFVEIRIETGRTHQIRVHFAHQNRPVLGDPEYGGRQKWVRGIDPAARKLAETIVKSIQRQALHARALTFTHPVSGKIIEIDSALPEDMQSVIALLESRQ